MHDAGYDDDFFSGGYRCVLLVGPIIPPSVPAVVYGTVASVSIGRLFYGWSSSRSDHGNRNVYHGIYYQ